MEQNVSNDSSEQLIIVGVIGAPFGIKGWLKIHSYTEPKSNIWNFKDWFINDYKNLTIPINKKSVKRINEYKDKFLVLIDGVSDRSKASLLTNQKILVYRNDFEILPENEYYWVDLIGCNVYDLSHNCLGIISYIFNNGANDVMVVKKDETVNLIPYSFRDKVIEVNLTTKTILVDWKLN